VGHYDIPGKGGEKASCRQCVVRSAVVP
jgi:hypothetical protein